MGRSDKKGAVRFLLAAVLCTALCSPAGNAEETGEPAARKVIDRTARHGSLGQERDSGNLFDAYDAWRKRRAEREAEEKSGSGLIPVSDQIEENGAVQTETAQTRPASPQS